MLELLFKSTLLLALALGIASCLPRTRPAQRHSVLLGALLLLSLVPLSVLLPPLLSVRLALAPPESPQVTESRVPDRQMSLAREPEPPQKSTALPFVSLALGLYLLITSGLILRQLTDHSALRRLLKTGVPSAIPAPFPVLLTPEPTVPLACGVLRRVILLPESAREWQDEHLQAVLLHESAHLHRRDPLWQALTELIRAFFWFHPLVWFVVVRLRLEAESACDRHVLASGIAPERYAHYLLEIVKMLKNRPVAPAMAHTPRLEGRVRSILAYLPTRPARGVGVALALLGIASVPLLAARPSPVPQQAKTPEKAAPTVRAVQVAKAAKPAVKAPKPAVKAAKPTPAPQPLRVAKRQEEKVATEKRRQEAAAEAERQRLKEQERKRREFRLEPLREELEELKLKLRNLDTRLTDKQLELASLDREKIAQQEAAGLIALGQVESIQKQIVVLEKMIEETRQKRERLRSEMFDRSNAQ